MNDLMRVAVVQPKRDAAYWFWQIFFGLLATALIGWWLMLIVGTVTPWDLSYWHSVLTLFGLRLVQVGSGWMNWTHRP